MKKKLFLAIVITTILCCLFAIGISASDFSTVTTSTTIDLSGMSTDTTSRVVLKHTNELGETVYTTYPSQYIVNSSSTLTLDFSKINAAFEGKNYDKYSVIRFEVPTTVNAINRGIFNQTGSNIAYVYVMGSKMALGQDCFHACYNLIEINLPENTTLQGYTFNSCGSLESVRVAGEGLKGLGDGNAFSGCGSLTHIDLAGGYTTIPGGTFNGCGSLEMDFDLSSVTKVNGNAFHSAKKLTFVNADKDMIEEVGQNAFFGCSGLTSISFSPKLSAINGYAFNGCGNLEYVEFNNNGSINPSTGKPYTFYISGNAFSGCSKLAGEINLKGCTSIGGNAFSSCILVTNYTNTDSITDIGEKAFAGTRVEEFYFPALTKISGKEIFNSNNNGGMIRKVRFGPNLTSIHSQAFAYSPALKELVFEGEIPSNSYSVSSSVKFIFLCDIDEFAINNSSNSNFSVYLTKTSIADVSFSNADRTTKNVKVYSCVDKKAVQINSTGDGQSEIDFVHLFDKTVESDPTCTLAAGIHDLCFCGFAISSVIEEGSEPLGHTDLNAVIEYYYKNNNYFDASYKKYTCTREGCGEVIDSQEGGIPALFKAMGMTIPDYGISALCHAIKIETDAVKEYNAYLGEGNEIKYGVLAGVIVDGNKPVGADGKSNCDAIVMGFESTNFSIVQLKLTGLEKANKQLYCGAYAVVDGTVSYLYEGTVSEYATPLTVNNGILDQTTPEATVEETKEN